MGNTCGCNQESLIIEQNNEVDMTVKEKTVQNIEVQQMESTVAEDLQSQDQQSIAQYTDR